MHWLAEAESSVCVSIFIVLSHNHPRTNLIEHVWLESQMAPFIRNLNLKNLYVWFFPFFLGQLQRNVEEWQKKLFRLFHSPIYMPYSMYAIFCIWQFFEQIVLMWHIKCQMQNKFHFVELLKPYLIVQNSNLRLKSDQITDLVAKTNHFKSNYTKIS